MTYAYVWSVFFAGFAIGLATGGVAANIIVRLT